MKKSLLFLAVMLFFTVNSYSQAGFNTGAIYTEVSEYGEIELFTPDSVYEMDRASILVGTSPTTVFDWWNDADIEEIAALVTNPALSDFEIYGAINNLYSELPPNVIVSFHVYGWTDGEFIIVRFNIKNNETDPINASAGLDIIPYIDEEWGYDSVTYNSDKEVIRFHRGAQTNMGMKLLSAGLSSLYSFEWYDGYQVDSDYWTWMNYGSLQPEYASNTGDGPVTITSQDPVVLAAGESFEVFYAMALGADESTMLTRIAAAIDKYEALFVSVKDIDLSVNKFNLGQNYPNPFNQSTTISYQVPDNGFVSLKIYNTVGKEVATLVNSNQTQGSHTIEFNAEDLTSGMYYCTLRCNGQVQSNKMFLVR
jgi:hypothetical protein